jgi:hypothetical protein
MKRLVVGLLLALPACHSTLTGCMPDAGETCKCTSSDTVRDCFDKRGNPGLEYCTGGMWTNCATFGDGGGGGTD